MRYRGIVNLCMAIFHEIIHNKQEWALYRYTTPTSTVKCLQFKGSVALTVFHFKRNDNKG